MEIFNAATNIIADPAVTRGIQNDRLLRSFISAVDTYYDRSKVMSFETFLKIYLTNFTSIGKKSTKFLPGLNTRILESVLESHVIKVPQHIVDNVERRKFINKEVKHSMDALCKWETFEEMLRMKKTVDPLLKKEHERAQDAIKGIRDRFIEALKENAEVSKKYNIIRINSLHYVIGVEDDVVLNPGAAFKFCTGTPRGSLKRKAEEDEKEPVVQEEPAKKKRVVRKKKVATVPIGLPSESVQLLPVPAQHFPVQPVQPVPAQQVPASSGVQQVQQVPASSGAQQVQNQENSASHQMARYNMDVTRNIEPVSVMFQHPSLRDMPRIRRIPVINESLNHSTGLSQHSIEMEDDLEPGEIREYPRRDFRDVPTFPRRFAYGNIFRRSSR